MSKTCLVITRSLIQENFPHRLLVNHFCDDVREYACFRAAVQSGQGSLRAKATIGPPAKPHLNAVSLAG